MNVKSFVKDLMVRYRDFDSILQGISAAGGTAFLVGGAVRDMVLNLPVKDIDIEVHGIPLEKFAKILEQHGPVSYVGKSFGVLKLHNNQDIDWSLPRTDSVGRKPDVQIDHTMTIEQALRRRDLTMNAMALDLMTGELHDPFHGREHIEKKILECPDKDFFIEDPLRFYRVMQFIGRFEMQPGECLQKLCKTMDVSSVSRERIEEEIKKLLLKSNKPSLGFRWLKKIGRLSELFPELGETVGVEQSKQWHPEGDVFEHTMQVVDTAVVVGQKVEGDHEHLILLYAALCHDLGKPITTVDHGDGRISSRGHEDAGVPIAKSFLARMCGNKKTIQAVAKLVKYHMHPGSFITNNARDSKYKKLALQLAPETSNWMLALLCEADKRGRNGKSSEPLMAPVKFVQEFIAKTENLGVLYEPEPAVLRGEDLLDVVRPGPRLGELVKQAYEIQINEGIVDKAILKKRVLN